jgi:D-allose transport system permease protein
VREKKKERKKMEKKSFTFYWEHFGTLVIFVFMILVTSLFAPPQFLSAANLTQIVTQSSTTMLLACGEFFAILIAGIDLSVGSVLALTGMVTAMMMKAGIHPAAAVLLGAVGMGALLGAINGILVNFTKLHPFIVTLGTQSIFRGITLIISNAKPVFGFPQSFKTAFGGIAPGGIPMPVVVALSVALVLWFLTSWTKMGRNFYAIGGNRDSAWYAGIDVSLHTLLVFVISGICAGLAGAVMIARLGSAESMAGTGHETFAIAASIIGGTSFFGGRGKIPNVIVGALIIGLINNALNMLSVETYYQQVATGSLIIGAVALDMVVSRKKTT